ncbi:MAG: hypothetical protein ACYC4P_11640 [Thermoanaerobaculia bacterium]
MSSPNVFRSLPPDRPRPSTVPAPRPAAPLPRPAAPAPRPTAPAAPLRPAAREDRPAPLPPLDRLRGLIVRFHLIDGAVVEGVLVELGKYEVLLRPEVGKTVVVFKASIAWAEEVAP